ncbi:bifunctional [glutamate--ammonia ligase]-adenylyl-L-tyrosine phosphorylase/[glutamate--ammonia-ligase] adenylyltransferase [Parahaliea sp. F7430]|uniref:Bifunctional glutamine synthetase adenylyltransferase/adenylyl-removing enzyme n=1 Tax=Sediminihaliea albiluteola TaxID=2758564 RepID=A0A7W2TXM4_9GAMM|nr:bifunctional [glutamate--ammonia ligase]-adenylyl-L-tyrosine phosphorylase/[glutamate--ammonia-ligase] adenylyltransferase [Sediminihaliea albiluteola]MBA6413836.1 bifunctional [glutamate--ammonia ligase]-adenylyl-L-tyrosine phosphorylase/[glutamate--ammonia-ligase] adenylyltransferase [Sediminihaliea albiluteola]
MNPAQRALPSILAEQAERARARMRERCSPDDWQRWQSEWARYPHPEHLDLMLACSPFVAELLCRDLRPMLELLTSGTLLRSLDEQELQQSLKAKLAEPELDLAVVLRRFRAQQMLRIVWRDFTALAATLETTRDTSLLAEACISAALEYNQRVLESRFGVPRGRHSGEAQQLMVLAMGKLGARELNISSDIDLIFVYPEAGTTDGSERSLSNDEFFTKLGQSVITALDQVTAEGFVFRVDMRLRPYGESGALVHNFSAMEDYYQEQGRDWERYALIKARALNGSAARIEELTTLLRPFIYRKYVDFGVIESLRSMKQMINSEVRRRALQDDIKLGHGGIREVEFIAQCFQLIRGGRDLGLQQRELLPVLDECAALGCLPGDVVAELKAAYLFLRDSEHALQGYRDQQTQHLPQDSLARAALAQVMDCRDWEEYQEKLRGHRERVAEHFRDLIAAPEDDVAAEAQDLDLWGEDLDAKSLAQLGYREPELSVKSLLELRDSRRVIELQVQGRERLAEFMPQLLLACAENEDPDTALARVLPLVTAVLRRSAYLALLLENPAALDELVTLCAASPWIAAQMAARPVLLDELLDRASLYNAPDKTRLQNELQRQVARLAVDDLEAQMEALRYFKASHTLRVAASELVGRLSLMKVSDKLSWLAEVILEQVLALAWHDLVAKYGEPARQRSGYGFAIFAYGKLGGIELSYSSDLDLVFVYDAEAQGHTDGKRSIDNSLFYTRLGQRIIHILQTQMSMGQLYEVDMRLRPSGESGMLVASTTGFDSYQRESAWTWEHQALVRARLVAGDPQVGEVFYAVRQRILCQQRDQAELAVEVLRMRDRMRAHLLPSVNLDSDHFYLKQDRGGIVDIEFMVQYAVLAWSHRVPQLAQWSDNVRILETLGQSGLFAAAESEALIQAYLAYRSAAHQLALQQQEDAVPAAAYSEHRAAVIAKWEQLFAPYLASAEALGFEDTQDK